MDHDDLSFLTTLERVIEERLGNPAPGSYTASLAAGGDRRIAQKVGEEAVELALAAVDGDRDERVNEAADLVYHLLVLLHVQNLSLADVVAVLRNRHTG